MWACGQGFFLRYFSAIFRLLLSLFNFSLLFFHACIFHWINYVPYNQQRFGLTACIFYFDNKDKKSVKFKNYPEIAGSRQYDASHKHSNHTLIASIQNSVIILLDKEWIRKKLAKIIIQNNQLLIRHMVILLKTAQNR